MRVHFLQHVPFEGPGRIADWVTERGHSSAVTHLYAGETPPEPDQFEFLVVMGGPMGVHDEAEFPWLRAEKRALEAAVATGKPVLGVCLGAQLLASVLGAEVRRNPQREIGWFEIERLPTAAQSVFGCHLPARESVFHWHGDTFEIPLGAVPLYRSQACENQAFIWQERVLALQFHIETTPQGAADLVVHARADLVPGRFVQDEAALLRGDAPYDRIAAMLYAALDRMTGHRDPA
ncbi:MAG: type 1 glutamine amidotransferase [Thiotrichales bacterium]